MSCRCANGIEVKLVGINNFAGNSSISDRKLCHLCCAHTIRINNMQLRTSTKHIKWLKRIKYCTNEDAKIYWTILESKIP